jgi:chemotaxis protein MotA
MIALLQTIGEPGAQDRIGPAMATALVATFYGLLTANLILIPIAEKLQTVSKTDLTLREIIKEGIMLVHEKKHPLFIKEYLESFLAPHQRQSQASSRISKSKKAA